MATDRARLLLHPVRMRVVIALSAEDLTTRQIHQLMPEVPQASLYRAIAQLSKAGIIEVVSQERRGGAMERTYHVAPEGGLMTAEELTSSTPTEFLAVVQTFANLMVSNTSRYLAAAGEEWSTERFGMRHESLWLTADQREELSEDLDTIYDKYTSLGRPDGSRQFNMQVAVLPEAPTPADVCPDGKPHAEAERLLDSE